MQSLRTPRAKRLLPCARQLRSVHPTNGISPCRMAHYFRRASLYTSTCPFHQFQQKRSVKRCNHAFAWKMIGASNGDLLSADPRASVQYPFAVLVNAVRIPEAPVFRVHGQVFEVCEVAGFRVKRRVSRLRAFFGLSRFFSFSSEETKKHSNLTSRHQ